MPSCPLPPSPKFTGWDTFLPIAKKSLSWNWIPLHPFLFAAHPILFLVVHNNVDFWSNAAVPMMIAFAVIALELLVFGLVLRDFRKAAVLISIWTLVFFWSMPIFVMIRETGILYLRSGMKHLFLLLFPLSAWFVWRTKLSLESLHFPLNAISSTLVLFVFVSGIMSSYETVGLETNSARLQAKIPLNPDTTVTDLPDIYVIIADAFAGKQCLEEVYGYDDEPFYAFLEEQGFQVSRNSFSNYSCTFVSMNSVMNMDYHDKILPQQILRMRGVPLQRAIEAKIHDSIVDNFLQEKGYQRIIITETVNEFEKFRPDAERTFNFAKSPEFLGILWKSTLLATINSSFTDRQASRRQTLAIFSSVKQIAFLSDVTPKYIYAHVICPHVPYVFNEDGSLPEAYGKTFLSSERRANLYLQQHKFVQNQLKDIVSAVIENSQTDPVIIILSDHSPGDMRGSPEATNFQRDSVLNVYQNIVAVRLPGARHTPLPKEFHNVNLFRFTLNELFGTEYEMTAPRFFLYSYSKGRIHETTENVLPIFRGGETLSPTQLYPTQTP